MRPAVAEGVFARHPNVRCETIPNGVDAAYFEPPAVAVPHEGPRRVVFTGHMSNASNVATAIYLVREIVPRLNRPVQLQIVGADPTEEVLALRAEGAEVTGPVLDVRPYLWNADCVAMPMVSGAGIKKPVAGGLGGESGGRGQYVRGGQRAARRRQGERSGGRRAGGRLQRLSRRCWEIRHGPPYWAERDGERYWSTTRGRKWARSSSY